MVVFDTVEMYALLVGMMITGANAKKSVFAFVFAFVSFVSFPFLSRFRFLVEPNRKVGTISAEFRTFPMEVLAGEAKTEVWWIGSEGRQAAGGGRGM